MAYVLPQGISNQELGRVSSFGTRLPMTRASSSRTFTSAQLLHLTSIRSVVRDDSLCCK
jgi:hypothetical protein